HQMGQHDLRDVAAPRPRIHDGSIDGVATRRVAAIGPVEHAMLEIELQVDRLGQVVEQYLDIGAVGRSLSLGDLATGAEDSAQSCIVRAFLRPVDLLMLGIERDANAPAGLVAAVGIAMACLNERLNMRAVETRAHDAHAFAIRPIELPVPLIEMQL